MAFSNKCIVKNNSVLQMFKWISKSIKLSIYLSGFRMQWDLEYKEGRTNDQDQGQFSNPLLWDTRLGKSIMYPKK